MALKVYYEEKHDKGSFIKNIISDNILISDIYTVSYTHLDVYKRQIL